MTDIAYQEAEQRIADQLDDDATLCGFIRTGHDDSAVYYLVASRDTYDDHEMLRVRYMTLGHAEWREDTWLKNGISIRLTDGIEAPLIELLVGAVNGNPDPHALYDEVDNDDA